MEKEEEGFKVPLAALGRRKRQEKGGRDGGSPQTAADGGEMAGQELTSKAGGEEVKGRGDDCIGLAEGGDAVEGGAGEDGEGVVDRQPSSHDTVQQSDRQSRSTQGNSAPPVPYTVPHWSGEVPSQRFSLSVIKNGTIIEEVDISNKAYVLFGRLPSCDVTLEHPSISRHHAVLQYRAAGSSEKDSESESSSQPLFSSAPKESGHYVYDLGSTHGTCLNKNRVDPRCYYRVRLGQMIKFGGSSRLFLLESGGAVSQEEVEEEAEQERREITARKEDYERRLAQAREEEERLEREKEAMGVSWGIMMDDVALGDASGDDYEIDEEKEAYYKEDPKKALKKFFDREGLELEYEVEEEGPPGSRVYTARVRLPIDTVSGEAMAEASVRGKKKEAVVLCALNACRMLDAHDILRQSAKAQKRKKRNWEENDYYSSEEDTFLDRTGNIEQKRKKRMKKAGVIKEESESYETLKVKLDETLKNIKLIEKKLRKDSQSEFEDGSARDSLDAYMKTIGDHMDKTKRSELKHELHELRREEERLTKLIKVAMPTTLPSVEQTFKASSSKVQPSKVRSSTLVMEDAPVISTVTNENELKRSERPTFPTQSFDSIKDSIPDDNKGGKVQRSSAAMADKEQQRTKSKKKKHLIGPALPPTCEGVESTATHETKVVSSDTDFCDWLPPEYQTGDGKTHLNEKFGY